MCAPIRDASVYTTSILKYFTFSLFPTKKQYNEFKINVTTLNSKQSVIDKRSQNGNQNIHELSDAHLLKSTAAGVL